MVRCGEICGTQYYNAASQMAWLEVALRLTRNLTL